MLSDILRIYQKNNAFLVLNPLFPSWITTNRTGLAVIKLYTEIKDGLREEEQTKENQEARSTNNTAATRTIKENESATEPSNDIASKLTEETSSELSKDIAQEHRAVEKTFKPSSKLSKDIAQEPRAVEKTFKPSSKLSKDIAQEPSDKLPKDISSELPEVISSKNAKSELSVLSEEKIIKIISEQIPSVSEKSISTLLAYAKSENLFCDTPSLKTHKPYFLNALYLNMTGKCNLRCSYCFAESRKEKGNSPLHLEDYERILEEAKPLSRSGALDIIFTGGEPLLSENTIPVAQICKKLGYTTRILTNGTLINEDNISALTDVFDFFKISLDGSSEEKHDFYRGSGSYKKTIHAINLLKERNVKTMLAMVVTTENKDDVKAMHEKWGNMITFQPLFPMGRAKGDNALSGAQYYDALSGKAGLIPFSNIQNIIRAHKRNRSIHKCALGDGELSISFTGDVYPCQLLHYDEFYLGNVRNAHLKDIYNSEKNEKLKMHTIQNIDKCASCDFRYLCGGACQARHFSETGSISKAGDFCEYEKRGIINGLIDMNRLITI